MVTHDMVLLLKHIIMIVAAREPHRARYGRHADKNFCLADGRLREL